MKYEDRVLTPSEKNIATGETSQAITPFHFFDYKIDFNCFGFYHQITLITQDGVSRVNL